MENNSENDLFKVRKDMIREVKGMRTYDDDPFFIKKLEEANKAFDDAPFPEHLKHRLERD